MTKFTVSRHVAYSADQVYAIASDVSSYRHFLPLMKKSDVFNDKDNPDGTREFDAELMISYKKLGINETMRSHVVANDAENVG